MEKENKQVLEIIEATLPQIDVRKQMDISYTQGVADGWKQALEYIKQQLEQAKEEK